LYVRQRLYKAVNTAKHREINGQDPPIHAFSGLSSVPNPAKRLNVDRCDPSLEGWARSRGRLSYVPQPDGLRVFRTRWLGHRASFRVCPAR